MKKKILIGLAIIPLLIQFFRIDQTNPTVTASQDFMAIMQPPADISNMMKSACYNCHSNETEYPWYAEIAPVSWWLKDHINEAREHLNFSEWGTYAEKKANHKLEEMYEEVEEGEMPLNSYTIIHGEADLTDEQREAFVAWIKTVGDFDEEHEHDEENEHDEDED